MNSGTVKDFFILMAMLLSTIFKILKPGGIKSIVAENIAIKQQLILVKRKSKITKSPPLSPLQKVFFALIAFLLPKEQTRSMAVILKP